MIETVGEATWQHSLRSVVAGGRVVVAGSTSGPNPPGELQRVFIRELEVLGSSMGTRAELEELIRMCVVAGVRPVVDSARPLTEVGDAIATLAAGEEFGKLVLVP